MTDDYKIARLYILLTAFSIFLIVLTTFAVISCSYNISMVHTEGHAEDVIDSEQKSDPNVSIPISPV